MADLYVKPEDQPPVLRFVNTAIVDPVATEQTGTTQYMDVIKVYIRAPGDNKTEVPDIAKQMGYEASEIDVERFVDSVRHVENRETGEIEKQVEKIARTVKEKVYEQKTIYPWLDKLSFRLKQKLITKTYYDGCMTAFRAFEKNIDAPINGTPLVDWRGAPESLKKKAIELGINTIEKAAEMTSQAMEALGMGAGDMKRKAQAWMNADRSAEQTAQKLVSLENENREKAEQLSALEAKLSALEAKAKPDPELEALSAEYIKLTGKEPDKRWGIPALSKALDEARKVPA